MIYVSGNRNSVLPFLNGAHGRPDACCSARLTVAAASAVSENEAEMMTHFAVAMESGATVVLLTATAIDEEIAAVLAGPYEISSVESLEGFAKNESPSDNTVLTFVVILIHHGHLRLGFILCTLSSIFDGDKGQREKQVF